MSISRDAVRPTPSLRGVSHLIAFFGTPLVALGLFSVALGRSGEVAAIVYSLGLATMFGASALLHRSHVSERTQVWLERLDYSGIFVFIAASYTPFCLLLGDQGHLLLALVWGSAVLGILRAFFWVDAPHFVAVALYLLVGWLAVAFIRPLWHAVGTAGLAWLVGGGVLYSLGAVVYALKRPDPHPRVFGFHEVFHVLVIVACACQLVPITHAVANIR